MISSTFILNRYIMLRKGYGGKNTSQEKIKFPWWQGAYYFNMSLYQLGK